MAVLFEKTMELNARKSIFDVRISFNVTGSTVQNGTKSIVRLNFFAISK